MSDSDNNNKFLAIMNHAWGAGETEEIALKQMKLAGGLSKTPTAYFVHEFSAASDPYIDQIGMMHWTDFNADNDNAIAHKIISCKIKGKKLVTGDEAQIVYDKAIS